MMAGPAIDEHPEGMNTRGSVEARRGGAAEVSGSIDGIRVTVTRPIDDGVPRHASRSRRLPCDDGDVWVSPAGNPVRPR